MGRRTLQLDIGRDEPVTMEYTSGAVEFSVVVSYKDDNTAEDHVTRAKRTLTRGGDGVRTRRDITKDVIQEKVDEVLEAAEGEAEVTWVRVAEERLVRSWWGDEEDEE